MEYLGDIMGIFLGIAIHGKSIMDYENPQFTVGFPTKTVTNLPRDFQLLCLITGG
jgi:hypothetical protein